MRDYATGKGRERAWNPGLVKTERNTRSRTRSTKKPNCYSAGGRHNVGEVPLVRRGVGRAAREAGDLARFLRAHSLDDNDAVGKLGHYDVGAIRAWYEAKKFPPLGEHARAALAEPQPGGSRNFDVAKKVSALMVALIADFGPPNLD